MRGVQGVGAAAMFAVSLALIAQEFPAGRERGVAMAVYGATLGIAVAIGPLAGGVLTEVFGWEAIFLVNVPIGIAALAATLLRLRETRRPGTPRIDRYGVITFTGALFLLVLGLLRGNAEGWGSPSIVAALAGAVILLVAFVAIEARVSDPMLPLGLLRRPAFAGVQIATVAVAASIFALFTYIALYLQNGLGLSPIEAGLRLLPSTAPMFLVPIALGAFAPRVSPRHLLAGGLVVTAAGLFWMSGLDADDGWTALLGGLTLTGVGIGALNPVIAELSVGLVAPERAGMAAGVNDTARQAGIAVGVALWGAVLLARGAERAAELLDIAGSGSQLPRHVVEAASTGAPAPGPGVGPTVGSEAFVAGLDLVLALGGVVALVGAAASLWLVRVPANREVNEGGIQCQPIQIPTGGRCDRSSASRLRKRGAGRRARQRDEVQPRLRGVDRLQVEGRDHHRPRPKPRRSLRRRRPRGLHRRAVARLQPDRLLEQQGVQRQGQDVQPGDPGGHAGALLRVQGRAGPERVLGLQPLLALRRRVRVERA
jgi:predicted MFS family arabinose efflux permease